MQPTEKAAQLRKHYDLSPLQARAAAVAEEWPVEATGWAVILLPHAHGQVHSLGATVDGPFYSKCAANQLAAEIAERLQYAAAITPAVSLQDAQRRALEALAAHENQPLCSLQLQRWLERQYDMEVSA